jgi:FO synthase
MSTLTKAIERAAAGEALPSQCASKALEQLDATFEDLCAAARERRERAWGRTVTFSPKAFLPVTNLCRNHCDYCTFRKAPDDPGAHTMALTEIEGVLDRASASGCIEALLCLGDKPEKAFSAYRKTLDAFGVASTVEHLVDASRSAWQRGMLAHTNAGLLNDDDMLALRP